MSQPNDREISREQQISFLKRIPFFTDFDDNELKQFLTVSRWLKVPADTVIIREEAVERVFYILVKGEVAVFKTTAVEAKELTRLGTGDCFGEMALVMATKRTAGVKAVTDSFLLMVDPEIVNTSSVFLQLKFYKRFCEIMVSRLIAANQKIMGEAMPSTSPIPDTTLNQQPSPPPAAQPSVPHPSRTQEKTPSGLPPMPNTEDRKSKTKIKRLISPEHAFPIAPSIATQLQVLFAQEGATNTRKFADLINLDLTLSSRVLQVANSSFYRRTNAVISVPHAMITLGMAHVQQIVTDTMETPPNRHFFSGSRQAFQHFWQHAIVVGRIAEMLQEIIRANTHIDIFLAGLLHDFGMLALDPLCPDFYVQCLRDESEIQTMLYPSELKYIGIDHGTAGCWLGEKMGLPPAYLAVMQHHHDPQRAREHLLPVALVHLANLFAIRNGVSLQQPDEEIIAPLNSPAWIILQEQHRPFMEVNVVDFIASFEEELSKTWSSIIATPKLIQ